MTHNIKPQSTLITPTNAYTVLGIAGIGLGTYFTYNYFKDNKADIKV